MNSKTQSTFPLILASPGEILKIEKIEAHPSDKQLLLELGLTPDILVQIKEKLDQGVFKIFCNGKLLELSQKLARCLKVSPCQIREKNSACSFCLHKGSCHG